MFLIILSSISLGIILTLAVQIFLLRKYFLEQPTATTPFIPQFSSYKLPKEIVDAVKTPDATSKKESCVCLNLLIQFLFRELKDTKMIREWMIKKLTVEFDEMMASTPGKLLENITLRDFNLGPTFPIIKTVSLKNIKLRSDESTIEELDILVDLTYGGGFQLAVDVDLVFNNAAYLCVKIAKLKGLARLRFSRIPYSHWSFSFCQEPEIDFQVESHLGTRPIPQITSLIINQVRRSIRKKHTLPNYKLRYKPFFSKATPVPRDISGATVCAGQLKVTILECSRLVQISPDCYLFCTLAVDQEAWVELSGNKKKLWITHELEVAFQENQSVGLIFKSEFIVDKYAEIPVVDTVIPNSPADIAGIKKNDLIISISGTRATSTRLAAKLIKQASDSFTIRIERPSRFTKKAGYKKSDLDLPLETTTKTNNNTSKSKESSTEEQVTCNKEDLSSSLPVEYLTKNVTPDDAKSGRFQFLSSKVKMFQRKKAGDGVEEEKSRRSLTSSPVVRRRSIGDSDIPLPHERVRRKSADDRLLATEVESLQAGDVNRETESVLVAETDHNSIIELKKTKLIKSSEIPSWKETFSFDVKDKQKFLNVGVWCRIPETVDKQKRIVKHEKDILLGHVSVPMMDIALDCLTTRQGDTQMTLNLSPPQQRPSISKTKFGHLQSHSGFDPSLCFGDITIAFRHITKAEKPFINSELLESSTDSSADDEIAQNKPDEGKHDFVATHFHTVTYCNFCSKKIWLKVAFQCRACAMICHKKCTERCQAQTTCSKDATTTKLLQQPFDQKQTIRKTSLPAAILNRFGRRGRERQRSQKAGTALGPEITCEPPTPEEERKPFQRPRSNSAPRNRLEDNHDEDFPRTQSSSKLDKMRHRRSGSVGYAGAGDRGWESDSSSGEDEMNLIQYLKDQQKVQQADEVVVTAAKEMGKELFANLAPEERREKLDAMVSKFQQEIDAESENRAELTRLEREAGSQEKKRNIQAKVKNADEKIQALALLMLHYCAGLQDCMDKMEEEKQKAKEEPWELMDVSEVMASGKENGGGVQEAVFRSDLNVSYSSQRSDTKEDDTGCVHRRNVASGGTKKEQDTKQETEAGNDQLEQWLTEQFKEGKYF